MKLQWTPEVLPNIATMVPYPPGKPIEETEREFGISGVVKLASNENPLGPSPLAVKAIEKASKDLNLYPDGSGYHLKQALAKFHGCTAAEICIGNGSNELIDLLPRAFVGPGRNIVSHKAAFVMYKLCAQQNSCAFIEAPIDDDLKVHVRDLIEACTADTKMVILANPNNPTGTYLDADEVEELARSLDKKKILLVLDYAYWEYVLTKKIPDPLEVYRKHPNVMLLKTFSKIYGLAGIRIGYLIARPELAETVEKCRQPFNVTSLGLAGAEAALQDIEHVRRSQELNRKERAAMEREFAKYPIRVYAGEGNFFLVDMKRPSKELYTEFLKRGVIIRPVPNYGFANHFRISVGLPDENKKLFQALQAVLGKGK